MSRVTTPSSLSIIVNSVPVSLEDVAPADSTFDNAARFTQHALSEVSTSRPQTGQSEAAMSRLLCASQFANDR